MKKFWKEFLLRGMMCAWCGPVIMCVIWFCVSKAGALQSLDVSTVVRETLSSMLVAFIAAGITAIHQQEQLPRGMAILIHAAVLYLDYLVIYLLNDWLAVSAIWIFTLCFAVGFALVWIIIFAVNRNAVNRMNARMLDGENN